MNTNNDCDLLIDVVLALSPQLGVLVPKYQDLVVSFYFGQGENIPQFQLRDLNIRSELFWLKYQTVKTQQPHRQINHLTFKIETYSNIYDSL